MSNYPDANPFQREANAGRTSLAREFMLFLSHNKKWWLLPILLTFVFFGLLLALGGTAAAPFIYTLF
jgi:hypothetical protein